MTKSKILSPTMCSLGDKGEGRMRFDGDDKEHVLGALCASPTPTLHVDVPKGGIFKVVEGSMSVVGDHLFVDVVAAGLAANKEAEEAERALNTRAARAPRPDPKPPLVAPDDKTTSEG